MKAPRLFCASGSYILSRTPPTRAAGVAEEGPEKRCGSDCRVAGYAAKTLVLANKYTTSLAVGRSANSGLIVSEALHASCRLPAVASLSSALHALAPGQPPIRHFQTIAPCHRAKRRSLPGCPRAQPALLPWCARPRTNIAQRKLHMSRRRAVRSSRRPQEILHTAVALGSQTNAHLMS